MAAVSLSSELAGRCPGAEGSWDPGWPPPVHMGGSAGTQCVRGALVRPGPLGHGLRVLRHPTSPGLAFSSIRAASQSLSWLLPEE